MTAREASGESPIGGLFREDETIPQRVGTMANDLGMTEVRY